jgi:methylenetetrahydrofolate reductase (NADPH)
MNLEIDHLAPHVEVLTPKQNSKDLDRDLERFANRYTRVMEAGWTVSITDNPMGILSFQATEVIPELGLEVNPHKLLIHLNTFHTKEHLDEVLTTAADMGAVYLLAISGDGGERLPKLEPSALGMEGNAVTAVELMQYIYREYADTFTIGVAFNPYEPVDHEVEKMKHKVDAGAAFVITQPIIGKDNRVEVLRDFNIPVIVGAWMSRKLHLLSDCVGYEIPEDTPYDPIGNLKTLRTTYPDFGLYLGLLGFKSQFPLLPDILKEHA